MILIKKKICVVVASRANYGRVKSVLSAIKASKKLELQLVVSASALLERYGNVSKIIKKDGFKIKKQAYHLIEGENLLTQSKSTGLGIIELSSIFQELKPDTILSVADRFETIATAIASTYLNIPLAHIQGGEISGNIDDKVRHAITKMADIHFPSTIKSAKRLEKMGERNKTIFHVGCPGMDHIKGIDCSDISELKKYKGLGGIMDWSKPYILMIQHPITTSFGEGYEQIGQTLNAMRHFSNTHQIVVMWPNADAGSEDVAKGIRVFREKKYSENFHFFKNFSPEDFIKVLANAQCAVGNSSSFIREGEFLDVPAVLIGDRQLDREIYSNCIISDYKTSNIVSKIKNRLRFKTKSKVKRNSAYGQGNAGIRIAKVLESVKLDKIKRLNL